MIPTLRHQYNASFSERKYQEFLNDLNNTTGLQIPFRVAESPVFVPSGFRQKLFEASETIIDFLTRPDFKALTENAIPARCRVPNETGHTHFLALDFAIIRDEAGELSPRLIELQGFPSLYGFQDLLSGKYREHFDVPSSVRSHFVGEEQYKIDFKKILLNGHAPENVVLLEIDPMHQNTAVDFLVTQKMTGIVPLHLGDVIREGRKLFYVKGGKRIAIERIYNRVIFDELSTRQDLKLQFSLTDDADVEWAGHPNWFFRISKFTMPMIKSPFIPDCKLLSEFHEFPADIENYVLKPLFSFSGSGVIFHLTQEDLQKIPEHEYGNFMLQKKVRYEPVIQSPDGLVKAEIRLLFFWDQGQTRPVAVTNLARLSRGEMIGVKFNMNKTWVGGSVCFFE